MSIVIFAETWNQKFKKSSLEAVSYGSEMAKKNEPTNYCSSHWRI
jgi:hypothetical protein